jgi:hypothetical protein
MHKFFNTAGPGQPERHYTVNSLPRLSGIRELIDDAHYFIIHAPGKREGCFKVKNMFIIHVDRQLKPLTVGEQAAS